MLTWNIAPADRRAMEEARAWMDGLIKPLGSLGKLEKLAIRLAGMTGRLHNKVEKTRVVVFAADNGIYAEGYTPVPQAVTATQAANMLRGICGINALCAVSGSELTVVDVGVAADMSGTGVIVRKVASGTGNITRGPAMTREQAWAAMAVGREFAARAADDGIDVLGVGEMGICNTATSAAVLCALTGFPVAQAVGRGAGIDDEGLRAKQRAIEQALAVNRPDPADALDVLEKVGGLDIAAMAGCYLGAAERRLPVVVDGFIAVVAALVAARLVPAAADYMIGSHCSQEPGYLPAARALGLEPYLDLNMRLGEGTGCPLAFGILRGAVSVCNRMGTFAQGSIVSDGFIDIRKTEE